MLWRRPRSGPGGTPRRSSRPRLHPPKSLRPGRRPEVRRQERAEPGDGDRCSLFPPFLCFELSLCSQAISCTYAHSDAVQAVTYLRYYRFATTPLPFCLSLQSLHLPQCDGGSRPALAGGEKRGECDLVVLDAGDVLLDAFAVRGPRIDAEGEVSSQRAHLRPLLLHLLRTSRNSLGPLRSRRLRSCRSSSVADGSLS